MYALRWPVAETGLWLVVALLLAFYAWSIGKRMEKAEKQMKDMEFKLLMVNRYIMEMNVDDE